MQKCIIVPNGKKLISSWDMDLFKDEYTDEETFKLESMYDEDITFLSMSDSVEVIGDKAFEHCINLKTVHLSKNLKAIGINCFWGCPIEDLYYPGSLFDFEKIEGESRGHGRIPRYHFKEGVLDYTNPKCIDIFPFNGTVSEWIDKYKIHWINFRANKIACTDGIIDCKELIESILDSEGRKESVKNLSPEQYRKHFDEMMDGMRRAFRAAGFPDED